MQWRALTLLLSGIAVIYLTILLQGTPQLHPKIVYTSNYPPIFPFKPDKLVLTTVGAYIYLTAFKYEATKSVGRGSVLGTGRLKLGVNGTHDINIWHKQLTHATFAGIVKQVKKPLLNLLTERDLLETDGWTPCFEHALTGPVSKVSVRNSPDTDIQTQFAVLYHQVEDDNSYHFARIYYTTAKDRGSVDFEYKDIQLPGTTWVDAISLENSSLLYSRDPDQYEFHIMDLPPTFMQPPHATLVPSYRIRHGRRVEEWSQPYSTEQYAKLLLRLYSPVVFTLSVHKTSATFYLNVTIVDNTTLVNADNKPAETWIQRERAKSEYPAYNEESIDYVGFADVSNYQSTRHQLSKLDMPELYASVSSGANTIVFPYIKNKFITLDFTDRTDILLRIRKEKERVYSNDGRKSFINEYYYWQGYETVDAEIKGLQLNDDDDLLALWTEFNYVYIYTRGKRRREPEATIREKFDKWVEYWLSDLSDEEQELRKAYLPDPLQLEMAIPPIKDEYGNSKVGSLQILLHEFVSKRSHR
ncbi:hypothetical protein MBANPS3_011413 [Mucor bainieri]